MNSAIDFFAQKKFSKGYFDYEICHSTIRGVIVLVIWNWRRYSRTYDFKITVEFTVEITVEIILWIVVHSVQLLLFWFGANVNVNFQFYLERDFSIQQTSWKQVIVRIIYYPS